MVGDKTRTVTINPLAVTHCGACPIPSVIESKVPTIGTSISFGPATMITRMAPGDFEKLWEKSLFDEVIVTQDGPQG